MIFATAGLDVRLGQRDELGYSGVSEIPFVLVKFTPRAIRVTTISKPCHTVFLLAVPFDLQTSNVHHHQQQTRVARRAFGHRDQSIC